MSITPASWSLGVLIGLPIVLFFLVGSVGMFLVLPPFLEEAIDRAGARISCVVVFLIALLSGVFAFWPYSPSFHRFYHVQGTVTEVGKRQVSDGDAMSERYVFVIGGQKFGVDDTRASLTKVGNQVDLMCKREYQYNSRSGWLCRWDGD